jgi:hypothetical protein
MCPEYQNRLFTHNSCYLAWYQEHGAGVDSGGTAGRSFYTSLGHLNESWEVSNAPNYFETAQPSPQDDLFMAHVMGGISWTLQGNTTRAYNSSGQVGNTSPISLTSSSPSSSSTSHPASKYVVRAASDHNIDALKQRWIQSLTDREHYGFNYKFRDDSRDRNLTFVAEIVTSSWTMYVSEKVRYGRYVEMSKI